MIGLLFDLDGTLLATLEDLADGTNAVLRQFDYPERTLEEIRQFVGNGAGQLIRLAVPEGVPYEPVLAAFQVYYKDHCQIKTRPYEGIAEALKTLGKKYPLAIVSNKPDVAVKPLCSQYFPGLYAQGETPAIPRKPQPQMVHHAMEALGVDRCIYIGDSEVDVETAQNAGVACLSVLWGFRDKDQLVEAGAKHFCTNPKNLVSDLEALIAAQEVSNGK